MLRDLLQLATTGLLRRSSRKHTVSLGRDIRQRAFDARDAFPSIEHADLAEFLGAPGPCEIMLPPIDVLSLSGLGFATPYVLLATIARALRPQKIFEIGTFRGVSALTFALNAPDAQIYTLDLPEQTDENAVSTLTKGDKEWVRLSRSSTGFAFLQHPARERIHQLRGDSLTFQVPAELQGVDLCFIDGGHSYECVKADTETALRLLKPGGVVVWDDYAWFIDGVAEYLSELRHTLPLQRIAGSFMVIYRTPIN